MKDVPAELPLGFEIGAMLAREDPRDALVTAQGVSLKDLKRNARLGTSSLRRQAQLLQSRDDLNVSAIRGNLQTRLRKLDEGEFDGIILAAAGLKRLGMTDRISEYLEPDVCLPAIGQGVVGVECRCDHNTTLQQLLTIQDPVSTQTVTAERAFGQTLGGDCQSPIAGFATLNQGQLWLRGLVATVDGKTVLSGEIQGDPNNARDLGHSLGQQLLDQGAQGILKG